MFVTNDTVPLVYKYKLYINPSFVDIPLNLHVPIELASALYSMPISAAINLTA